MSPDTWIYVGLLLVGTTVISCLAGYGFGWRDGYIHFAEEEVAVDERASDAANSDGWRGEALEWRVLIKAAAMRDMEIPVDEPAIHEDLFA